MGRTTLTLYVNLSNRRSREAVSTMKELCQNQLADCTLEIVSVHEQPERAKQNNIWNTPVLVRKSPSLLNRVVGSFSNKSNVLNSVRSPFE